MVRFLFLSLSWVLLTACGSIGTKEEQSAIVAACVQPQSGEFATVAHYWLDTSAPQSIGGGIYGDLVVTDTAVRFVKCDNAEGALQPLDFPHAEVELVYRDGSWLFLRSLPKENGRRAYSGFAIQGIVWKRAATFAKEALAEIGWRRAKLGLRGMSGEKAASELAIVSTGIPELNLASIDRSKLGAAVAGGAAGGALGGVVIGLQAGPGIILYPPAAVVLLAGGAVVGAAAGAVAREQAAQSEAQIVTPDDGLRARLAVLVQVLHELEIGPTLAKRIEPMMRIESAWPSRVVDVDTLGCGRPYRYWCFFDAGTIDCSLDYRDCALRGVAAVVEIDKVHVELRADKADLERDADQAQHTLRLFLSARLHSTLSGRVVDTVQVSAFSDQNTFAEWLEQGGTRFRGELEKMLDSLPSAVALDLQRSLHKLPSLE